MNPHGHSRPSDLEFTEPERYELHEGPFYHFEINRREFVGVLGAGILISVAMPAVAQRARGGGGGRPVTLAERLHIAPDGVVTVMTSKVEVGQGSRTQLTQAAAEELTLPLARVRLIMADTAMGPDDGGTAGSRTTPSTVPAIRKACAAARQLLIDTAASAFSADAKSLTVRDGKVQGLPAGKEFSYADLAAESHREALKREVAPNVSVSDAAQWTILGAETPRVSGSDIVGGKHRYPSDIVRPGMLHGKVLRPASFGAQLLRVDLQASRAIEGVTAVQDGDFVGFAAPNSFAAEQARDAAAKGAEWKAKAHPSSDELYTHLRTTASSGRSGRNVKGTPEEAFKTAAKKLRESYHIAYIQHAPMEPRAAVAEWKDEQLTVWTGSQQPARVRGDLAQAFRIGQDKIRVIVPDTGGGFGGKHSGEVAVEAARLAKAAQKPVCVRWTREEEFTWAYFRPAGVIDMAGALDETGKLIGWEHVNFNSGASAIAMPYAVANSATEFKNCDGPLRSGSYRALASTANAFARESFMDELAAAAGVDPLQFRLNHPPSDRLRAVLVAATDRFGWKKEWKNNSTRQKTGVGLACGTEKGSYVATCARVEINPDGSYKVVSAVTAFECGAIQNPLNLQAQVDGCVAMGLGGALREEMRFKDGRMLNASFRQYRVPRLKDLPELDTVLLNRKDLPSVGAGETPIIGIAPAIANALFNAVQVRIRSLPIRNDQFRPA